MRGGQKECHSQKRDAKKKASVSGGESKRRGEKWDLKESPKQKRRALYVVVSHENGKTMLPTYLPAGGGSEMGTEWLCIEKCDDKDCSNW